MADSVDRYLRAKSGNVLTDTAAQAAWAEKRWVWIEDKDECYAPANIVSEDGDKATVELPNKQVHEC